MVENCVAVKKEDSLKKRYFFKLSTNLFGMAMGLLTAGMVPRALGPAAYGSYTFLTNFFMQVVNFMDMGTSTCFFSKLSQRPKDSGLISFYFYFVTAVVLLVLLGMLVIFRTSVYAWIWPGQAKIFIVLAAGWGLLNWLDKIFIKITDAYGLTVVGEIARVINRALMTAGIIVLFVSGWLTLASLFGLQYASFIFLLVVLVLFLIRNRITLNKKITFKEAKLYAGEFFTYSHPLFIFALAGLVTGILDRWLLQVFGGSVQQGFYGLSYTIGTFCFMFTSAMQPLLMREFSIAHGRADISKMAVLFRKYIPMLYSIAVYFACFIAVQSDKVVYILGGKTYEAAFLPVAIMAFYPIHQTYGQLSGSVFMATGQTALYRNIGLVFMVIGLLATYLFIAPAGMFGLEMGATGLAIKMVLVQFVAVNVQLYFNMKYLKRSFARYFGHQILSLALLLFLSLAASMLGNMFLSPYILPNFIFAGLVYSVLVLVTIAVFPVFFGMNKEDLRSIAGMIKLRISR